MSDWLDEAEHWLWRTAALIVAIASTLLTRPSLAGVIVLAWPVLFFGSAIAGFVGFNSRSRGLTVMAIIPVLIATTIFAGVTLRR